MPLQKIELEDIKFKKDHEYYYIVAIITYIVEMISNRLDNFPVAVPTLILPRRSPSNCLFYHSPKSRLFTGRTERRVIDTTVNADAICVSS